MSEDQYTSKRERQKARRAQRLEREARQQKVANRRQRLVYGVVVVVVLAVIGGLVLTQITSRRQASAQAEEVAGRLEELGCTEDTAMPDLGGGHIPGAPAALAAEPPELIYTGTPELPGEPPSSGRHLAQVAPTGVYDVPIDPRLTTHNLEHGYIIAHYAPDAPEDQVAELKAWAQEQIDGDFPKMIVTEYYTDLPGDANFSYTAWFRRQTCDTFDADVAEVFARAHHGLSGDAPEKTVAPHNAGAGGVIDPEGEPLLLPPLDSQFGGSGAEEIEGAEPASPTRSATPGG